MTISISTPTSNTGSIQNNSTDVLTIGSDNSVSIDTNTLHVDATNNRVGIGTSNPSSILDVQAASGVSMFRLTATTGTNAVYSRYSNTGGYLYLGRDNSSGTDFGSAYAAGIWSTGAYPMLFGTNGTEKMRIDAGGNVAINSTTTTSGLSAQLFVKSDNTAGKYGIGVGYGTSALQWRVMYMNSGDGNLYFHNGNNYANLSSAGAWTNASDERLKNNIVDIKYGLDAVLNTQPRSYKMNDVEGDFIGFVAQELQTVIPEVVSGDPEKQLGVDYGSLVAVAFKAIQELKTENDTLKSQLSDLETRIQALENN